jgi:hypothetical protein
MFRRFWIHRKLRQLFRPVCFCLASLVVAVALVLVPTVMRARQHLSLHENTRLSIRLNWQSDAPPPCMW